MSELHPRIKRIRERMLFNCDPVTICQKLCELAIYEIERAKYVKKHVPKMMRRMR